MKSTDYIVNLKALESGSVSYDYKLNDAFFKDLDQTLISGGQVDAHVNVNKLAYGSFEMIISIVGEVTIQCDRCLDDMSQPVEAENKLLLKFGETYRDDGDELIVVAEDEGTIDVSWLMYEVIVLAIPLQHVHPDGECNSEMMKLLELHSVTDSENNGDSVDERWNDLRKINQ